MSNTSESHEMSTCANCGKGEESSIDLKSCAACMLVKYCSRDCQAAHRPQHKKACKKRAKELHDEKLFKQPLPLEDCPICMIRLPTLESGRSYMACCGKVICCGCVHAVQSRAAKEEDQICPFCRTIMSDSEEEAIKRLNKRMELNDPVAIRHLGCSYSDGRFGLPQDRAKKLELYHRAGELGEAQALHNLSCVYRTGRGVEVDEKKAKHYGELAATKGYVLARCNLGCKEARAGIMDRALKH